MKRPLEDQIRRYTQAIDGMAPPVEELMPEAMREASDTASGGSAVTTIPLRPTKRQRTPAWAFAVAAAAFVIALATPLLLSTDEQERLETVSGSSSVPVPALLDPDAMEGLNLSIYPLVFDGATQTLSGSGWPANVPVEASLTNDGQTERSLTTTTDEEGTFVTGAFGTCCADAAVLTVTIGGETVTSRIDRGVVIDRLDPNLDVVTLVYGAGAEVDIWVQGPGEPYMTTVFPDSDWWSLDLGNDVDVVTSSTATAVLFRDGVAFVSPTVTTEHSFDVVLDVSAAFMEGRGFSPNETLAMSVNGMAPLDIEADDGGHFAVDLPSTGVDLADGDVVALTHRDGYWERVVPIVTFDSYERSSGLGSGIAPGLDAIDTIAVRIRNAGGPEFESTRFNLVTSDDGTWSATFEPLGPGDEITDSWALIGDGGFQFARSFGVIPETSPDESGSVADPVLNPDNGHYYQAFYVPLGATWEEAMLAAQEWSFQEVQGHLVTITSAAESDFITETFPEATSSTTDSNPYWIGAFQPEGALAADADWEWVTGEPFEYSNWDPLEPNDPTGGEQCINFTHGMEYRGMWNDQPCDDRSVRGFIVEFDF